MKETVRLTQLYKASAPDYIAGTCHLNDHDAINGFSRFECKIQMPKEQKELLWNWVEWKRGGIKCNIEFEDVTAKGLPINAVITGVHGFDYIKT